MRSSSAAGRGRLGRWGGVAPPVLVALLALCACRAGDRGLSLPAGDLLAGNAARLSELLERLAVLPESPLTRGAREAVRRIEGCDKFEGFCRDGGSCSLPEELRCSEAEPEEIAALRAGADWLFVRSRQRNDLLIVRGRTSADGSVVVDAELPPLDDRRPLSLLLPASEPAGPGILSRHEALIHLRLRPDQGLNVAEFLPAEDLGARLYRLRSELFLATTLAGTWELAVYLPDEGQRIPPIALALDVADRERTLAAMERFVAEVMEAWPVRRGPFALGGWEGACLSNLRVLPELEPCYLVTDRSLVVGWSAQSMARALAAPAEEDEGDNTLAVAYLDRFPLADRRLAATSGARLPAFGSYPWRRAVVSGGRVEDLYRLRLELKPGGAG